MVYLNLIPSVIYRDLRESYAVLSSAAVLNWFGHRELAGGELLGPMAHVEMFPATASQYAAPALNELTVILLNARAGMLRSFSVQLRE